MKYGAKTDQYASENCLVLASDPKCTNKSFGGCGLRPGSPGGGLAALPYSWIYGERKKRVEREEEEE